MWKTTCGKCIYQSPTGISVYQNLFFRWLKFEGPSIQTLINRIIPSHPELYYIKILTLLPQLIPGPICMLGLGGGGALHALSPIIRETNIVVVEKDQEVIEIATKFFKLARLKPITLIHQDAVDFVKNSTQQFRHLLIDIFNSEQFPISCFNEDFFHQCARLLLPGGILAINLANPNEQWPIFLMLKESFGRTLLSVPIQKSANMILFASNETESYLLNTFKPLKQMRHLYWHPKWGNVGKFK